MENEDRLMMQVRTFCESEHASEEMVNDGNEDRSLMQIRTIFDQKLGCRIQAE